MADDPAFQRGDEVYRGEDRSQRGIVREGRTTGGAPQYLVRWDGGREAWVPAAQLAAPEPETLGWASRGDFLADLVLLKFFHGFSDVLFSIGSSRTQFLVYQYKPVLQFVRQSSRGLLIADEVGLGKTIEAALILREMMARGSVERLLVLCPANLRRKWQSELRQRFGVELREMRAQQFQEMADQFASDSYWPDFFGVASLEGLRMTDFERTLVETGVHFDLVIVDEGHHLRNPATRSFELGEVLSDQSDHILLLSATPIQTGQSDLQSLLRLVDPAEFRTTSLDDLDAMLEPNRHVNAALSRLSRPDPDLGEVAGHMRGALGTRHGAGFAGNDVFMSWLRRLEDLRELTPEATVSLRHDLQRMHTLAPYYTRTRKREVEETAERTAQVITVPLAPEEQEFYDAWVAFLIERSMALKPGVPPGWNISMYERMAASSLQAAHGRMDDLIAGLAGGDRRRLREISNDYEGEDPDQADPDQADDNGDAPDDSPSLRDAIERIEAAAADLPEQDSKLDTFIELIDSLLTDKPERKILVFTFFKFTLRYLQSRLGNAGIGCVAVSGDDGPERRADIIDGFREDPDRHVLLSTEVGSEGLDFQFCDAVVNYDLPWNPMRVEQRIGRIDRFGQREPQVVVASFFAEETIDTRILERLYERIGVFEQSIGELEPILGPAISELQADALTRGLTPEQQERRANDRVLRIEERKQAMEQFESARAELMGHGDLLGQEIENTRSSGRYVTPAEVEAVVRRWLRHVDERIGKLDPVRDRVGFFDLEVSEASAVRVRRWMQARRMGHPDTTQLLGRLQRDKHAWVTFSSEKAREREGPPFFLHTGHPLVRTAIEDLTTEEPQGWIARVGCFALPSEASDAGARDGAALAIYRLGVRGLESQETILPVAVSLDSHEALGHGVGDLLLGALAEALPVAPPDSLDEGAIRSIEQAAHEQAEHRRSEAEELERGQQAARVAVRKATLERTYGARVERAGERLASATDERIVRMYEGRLRNLRAELQQQIGELDTTRQPTAEFELLAMAIFTPPNGR